MTISKNDNFRQKNMKAIYYIPFVFLSNSAIFSPCHFLMNLNPITLRTMEIQSAFENTH